MITTNAKIELEREISKTLSIFRVIPEKKVKWFPGMFMQLSLVRKSASEPWLDSKPFTIASWGNDPMKIIVRKEGKFTTELFSKGSSGISGTIRYPLGNFFINNVGRKVFLAGGAGISAFTAFLDYIHDRDISDRVRLYHSSRTIEESIDTFYWNEISPNVTLKINVTRDQTNGVYDKRLTLNELKNDLNNMDSYEYYVCGPPSFTEYWRESLAREKIDMRSESWIVS